MLEIEMDMEKEFDALNKKEYYDYCNALASFEPETVDLGRWKM